jgi:hypothetical protein
MKGRKLFILRKVIIYLSANLYNGSFSQVSKGVIESCNKQYCHQCVTTEHHFFVIF